MADDWIQQSVPKSRRGVFKKKAQRAGKTTRQYAEEKKNAPGKLGHEAREALTLMDMHGRSHADKLYGKK